jgi:hypothetical protein
MVAGHTTGRRFESGEVGVTKRGESLASFVSARYCTHWPQMPFQALASQPQVVPER